jgi:hypothetical protein
MSIPSVLEILELPTGEIIVRRSDTDGAANEPLVRIKFSQEAREMLGEGLSDVGRAMINAGMNVVGEMYEQDVYSHAESAATLH